jgi:transcriptional regulator GlxA family with amidase domain
MRETMHAIVLYEGVSAHEALGALAALRAAGLDAELVAADALVATHEGARIVPHTLGYARVEPAAAAILPGGDVAKPLRDAALLKVLRARRGRWTLASGEAVRIAAAAGLAEGRRVARLPGESSLADTHAAHARLVADGRLLTCFPGEPLVDLVLHLVEREHGAAAAQRAAHTLGRQLNTFALGASGEA